MSGQAMDSGKIGRLAELLEIERRGHCTKRLLCASMFGVFFFSLVVSVGIAVFFIVANPGEVDNKALALFGLLGALSTAVMSLFGTLFTVQNCINSIERTLFFAKIGDMKMFEAFLDRLECASKDKRGAWLAVAKAAVLG